MCARAHEAEAINTKTNRSLFTIADIHYHHTNSNCCQEGDVILVCSLSL